MQAILDFGQTLADLIFGFADLVESIFLDIVYAVNITGLFLAQIPTYFSWMPLELVGTLVVLFAIAVVYKILGREG